MRYNALLVLIIILLVNPFPISNDEQIIIEFIDNIDENIMSTLIQKYDIRIIDRLKHTFNGYIAEVKQDIIDDLEREPIIKNVYHNEYIKISKSQTNLELIGIHDTIKYDGTNLTGKNITVAIIDTGIDVKHTAFNNIIGGYDFLDKDNEPNDIDGHGTMVAGVIASHGAVKGIAPDVNILAYKIAAGNRYVSSNELIQAIERSAIDNADILNISIGLDHINESIDRAINSIVDKGVVVIVAAGNDGEKGLNTIKSPGSAFKAITVGATLNNINEPLLATLKVMNNTKLLFHPIPMVDTVYSKEPIKGRLVFTNYAREVDIKDMDLNNTIVLAERGGAKTIINGIEQNELIYFSDKEYNTVKHGAKALIIYNNEEGLFRGKLLHEDNKPDYKPSIPVISLSREEGLLLKELLKQGDIIVELRVYNDPNIVAEFSSKGPVSKFYMKPDLVAPGVMINSTSIDNSYNVSTGTSFAAPHVSGAAALLLELHPDLKPRDVASLLVTTADPLIDQFGNPYSFDITGAGKLNVTRAIHANIIAEPYYLILYLSPNTDSSKVINLRMFKASDININILTLDNNPFEKYNITINTEIESINDLEKRLIIHAHALDNTIKGRYEGRIYITSNNQSIAIPLIIYVNEISINASNVGGMLKLSIDKSITWESAKIRVIDSNNNLKNIITLTPNHNNASVYVNNIGEYWVEASIISDNNIINSFTTVYVNNIHKKEPTLIYLIDGIIPLKESIIILSFIGIISAIILIISHKYRKEKSIADQF